MRRIAAGLALALFAIGALTLGPPASNVAAAPRFGLVDQTFNLDANGSLGITLQVPSAVTPPATDFVLTVTAFRAVTTRAAVADAINGDLSRSIDSVDLDPTLLSRPATDQLRAAVPTEVTTRTPGALQLAEPGVYPLLVELSVAGEVVAELTTFVHRVAGPEEDPEQPMPIAMAMSTETPVVLDDDGRVVLDDTTLRELTTAADLLEASAVPVGVRIPPSVLAALHDAGDEAGLLADRLSQAMQRNDLLSSPILPLDPSQAAAADQQALYTQWLRDGEDSLSTSMSAPTQRTIVLADAPLSQAGGRLLRDLGARLLVMPAELYDALPNTLGGFTDTTQLVQVQVAPDVTVDAAIVDRGSGRYLTRITTTPELSAIYAVTDLLAARRTVEDAGGDPRRHGITIATPDLTLPSPTGFTAFTTLLSETPGLTPTTLDDLSVRTDQLLGPEGPIVVDLPEAVDGDITERIQLTTELGLRAASTASMLPDDDPRVDEWTRLIGVLPTPALTDAQATAIAADLRAQYDGILASVELPRGFSFNLTDTTGTVPIKLKNHSDIPLTVRIRLTSPKLTFPDGDQTVVVPPQSFQVVEIALEARSNGTSTVTLEVFTPLGDARVAPPVPLTATINALSGIGLLLTGTALLALFTWWLRHIGRNRRARRAAEAAHRHPATRNGDTSDGDDGGLSPDVHDGGLSPDVHDGGLSPDRDTSGLSPDAATSTLPPS